MNERHGQTVKRGELHSSKTGASQFLATPVAEGILPAVEPGFPPTRHATVPLRRDGRQPGGKNHTHFVSLSTAVPPAGAPVASAPGG